ncbi:hypothetical protein D3Z52_22355 [Clostridiaceae bacterium]|nr:hypothetical protein [Clostridiaceae bacterium]
MKRPLAYITAPWSKNPHENAASAASYCRQVYDAGYSPVCPVLFLPLFLKDEIPQEHKDGIDIARDFVVAKSAKLRFRLSAKTASAPLLLLSPQNPRFCGDPNYRSHVLVVCGHSTDETVKNDIATAERLRITATTLDGILTVKGQGREKGGAHHA